MLDGSMNRNAKGLKFTIVPSSCSLSLDGFFSRTSERDCLMQEGKTNMEMDQQEVFPSCADGQSGKTEMNIDSQSKFNDFFTQPHCQKKIQKSQQAFGYRESKQFNEMLEC
jgi:hypothetical protein